MKHETPLTVSALEKTNRSGLVLAIGFHRSTVFAMGLELPPCLIFSLFCLLVPVFMAYNGG